VPQVGKKKHRVVMGYGLHLHISALNRDNKNHFHPQAPNGGFLKWWYPTTSAFPTKNDHVGVFWGTTTLGKTQIVQTPLKTPIEILPVQSGLKVTS